MDNSRLSNQNSEINSYNSEKKKLIVSGNHNWLTDYSASYKQKSDIENYFQNKREELFNSHFQEVWANFSKNISIDQNDLIDWYNTWGNASSDQWTDQAYHLVGLKGREGEELRNKYKEGLLSLKHQLAFEKDLWDLRNGSKGKNSDQTSSQITAESSRMAQERIVGAEPSQSNEYLESVNRGQDLWLNRSQKDGILKKVGDLLKKVQGKGCFPRKPLNKLYTNCKDLMNFISHTMDSPNSSSSRKQNIIKYGWMTLSTIIGKIRQLRRIEQQATKQSPSKQQYIDNLIGELCHAEVKLAGACLREGVDWDTLPSAPGRRTAKDWLEMMKTRKSSISSFNESGHKKSQV